VNLTKSIKELQEKYESEERTYKEISDAAQYLDAMSELNIEVII